MTRHCLRGPDPDPAYACVKLARGTFCACACGDCTLLAARARARRTARSERIGEQRAEQRMEDASGGWTD